jgi:hypothetical protein
VSKKLTRDIHYFCLEDLGVLFSSLTHSRTFIVGGCRPFHRFLLCYMFESTLGIAAGAVEGKPKEVSSLPAMLHTPWKILHESTEPSSGCLCDLQCMSLASIARPMTRHSPRAHGVIHISAVREDSSSRPPGPAQPTHPFSSVRATTSSIERDGGHRAHLANRARSSVAEPSKPSLTPSQPIS